MGTDIYAGPLGEARAASTAGGGTALTTTAAFIQLPAGTKHIFVTPRNFSGAAVAKIAFNPWLTVLKTADNLATPPVDYSEYAQDGSTGTSVDLSSFSTLANGDFLLVGAQLPFRGVAIDVDGAHAGDESTLTVAYWNGVAWTSISATDGTSSASKTMAVDGNVTWTVPSAWVKESLKEICARVGPATSLDVFKVQHLGHIYLEKLYWTRWVVSAALDSAVTLDSMLAMNRSTAYSEWVAEQSHERRILRGFGENGIGCIEALTDAGTANLIVNCDSGNGQAFG